MLAALKAGIGKYPSSPRSISTDPLSTLLCVHGRPIELVVYQCSYSLKGMGELISRWASRLDAFSGYPIRRNLPSIPLAGPQGPPEAGHSRPPLLRTDPLKSPTPHAS